MTKTLLSLTLFFTLIPTVSAEYIHSFNSDIQIVDEETILINETIVYDFEGESKHGIFRDIPGDIKFISVTDEKGSPYPYETSTTFQTHEAKIGDPAKTITGEHTYHIVYQAKNELGFFRDHDELYWNVNGTYWSIPINTSSATVTFPFKFDKNNPHLKATCYTGSFGEKKSDCTYSIKTTDTQTIFTFQTTKPLYRSENMTIVAGIPKTYLDQPIQHASWGELYWGRHIPTLTEKIINQMPLLLFSFFLFLWTFKTWRKRGDDPAPLTPIIAHYSSPNHLLAAELSVLRFDRLTPKAVTATIFELGIKGILTIKENEKKSLTFHLKTPPKNNELSEFQQYVYDKIFEQGTRTEVELSKLKYKLRDFTTYQKNIIDRFLEEGYYQTRPFNLYKFIFIPIGIITAFIGFSLPIGQWLSSITLLIAGFTSLICGIFMTKKTQLGVELTQQIKGFEEFLKVTEKERLTFHNPPNKTIELFEAMLPFAVALNVEEKWVESFQSLIEQMKDANIHSWLNIQNFESSHLTKTFESIQSIGNSPSSGGSGFSGGSSGGGGGGGGGGSW